MRRLAFIPLLAFVFACNDSQPLAPDDLAPQLSAAGAPIQSASGSGHFKGFFINPDVFPGRILGRTFAFTAKKWADGSVTGQWERKRKFPQATDNLTSHGVVTCMTIVGNTAYLGGYATSGLYSDPDAPGCTDDNFGYGCGNEVGWFVVDNGQGANDPPDGMSGQWVEFGPGFADDFCETQKPLPGGPFPVEAGNINVNG